MRSRVSWNWGLGVWVSLLALAAAGIAGSSGASAQTLVGFVPGSESGLASAPLTADDSTATEEPSVTDLADAPAKPISDERPVPSNVRATGPAQEVVKLANAGVDESVLLAFVTNSFNTFNLNADEVIYLNDIGVPGSVVTAMIQRDQTLKAIPTNAAGVAATPPNVAFPSAPAPASGTPTPAEVAPQFDDSAGTYPGGPPAPIPAAGDDSVFYNSLAPYGTWVEVDGIGRCWRPTAVIVNPGWRPYFNGGHWVDTDCGWYWYSDYSWGWAPFHYGRWFPHHRLGWCWAPGRVWGPSWVCWRYTDDYCGWAPLPPAARFVASIGLTFNGQGVGSTFGFGLTADCFPFVPWRQFPERHLDHYALPPQQAAHIFNRTAAVNAITLQNSRVINAGVPREHVATTANTDLHKFSIHELSGVRSEAGRGERLESSSRTLTVYRPHFPAPAHTSATAPRPASGQPRPTPAVTPAPMPQPSPWQTAGRRPTAQPRAGQVPPLIMRGREQLAQDPAASRSGLAAKTPSGPMLNRQFQSPSTPASPAQTIARSDSHPPSAAARVERQPAAPHSAAPKPSLKAESPPSTPSTLSALAPAPRQYTMPTHEPPARHEPAQVPRYPTAPSSAPAPARSAPAITPVAPAASYSAPAVAPAARTPDMGARPTRSAPAPPATSYSPPAMPPASRAPDMSARPMRSDPPAPAPFAPAARGPSASNRADGGRNSRDSR